MQTVDAVLAAQARQERAGNHSLRCLQVVAESRFTGNHRGLQPLAGLHLQPTNATDRQGIRLRVFRRPKQTESMVK